MLADALYLPGFVRQVGFPCLQHGVSFLLERLIDLVELFHVVDANSPESLRC